MCWDTLWRNVHPSQVRSPLLIATAPSHLGARHGRHLRSGLSPAGAGCALAAWVRAWLPRMRAWMSAAALSLSTVWAGLASGIAGGGVVGAGAPVGVPSVLGLERLLKRPMATKVCGGVVLLSVPAVPRERGASLLTARRANARPPVAGALHASNLEAPARKRAPFRQKFLRACGCGPAGARWPVGGWGATGKSARGQKGQARTEKSWHSR